MVLLDANKVRAELESLKNLPNFKEVIALRKRLEQELEKLEIIKEEEIQVTEFPKESRAQKISKTLKKQFRYLRLIRNQFPEIPWLELRREFTKKKKGLESKIPDVVWQNPSP